MQEKNTSLILWSVQDLASSNAWEVSAQAEPEAWVMFFLTSCVNISSFQTDLVVFPGTETALKACRRFLYQPYPWTATALWKGTRTFSEAGGTWRTLNCSPRDFHKDRAVTEFPLWLSWSLLIFFAGVFVCKLSVCHARSVPLPAAFVVLSPGEQIVQHPC